MNQISVELPVKLEELCQLSFNFNNLIKIIQYLHNNNISFQKQFIDIDKRLTTVECLQNDIEDLKIKTKSIERTSDNLNRSFANLQDNILRYDSKFSEIQKKTAEIESKIEKTEKKQNEHEQNFNHLNKALDDNAQALKEFDNELNAQKQNLAKLSEKMDENEKNGTIHFENIDNNIKEINQQYDEEQKEIKDIKAHLGEIQDNIKNINNNYEKKIADINERIANIVNDIADMNKNRENNINKNTFSKHLPTETLLEKTEPINKNINSTDLFKISMENIEEVNKKLIQLKEDYDSNKEKQKKENIFMKKNISEIIDDYNKLKAIVEKNAESLENNMYNYINIKNEETEPKYEKEEKKPNKNEGIDLKQLHYYLNKFVPFDIFKKLSDNVRILTSSLTSKINREEVEVLLKKFNQRMESIEMIQQGQTHGPKTRINLGLVNMPITHIDDPNIPLNNDEQTEIEHLCKRIEKKVSENIMRSINKEIQKFDLSLNPKIIEIETNLNQILEDMDKNNTNIADFRNILLSNPSQNDFLKIKKSIEELEDECRNNKLKLLELTNFIEGSTEENDGQAEYALSGTIKDKINFLNKSCQTLNTKIGVLENKNRTFTKEVKDEIKQNLKNETIKIMQQFKTRLESFTTKFEHELKNKIDQINLSDFENKMNNKIHIDLKDKLDKNDLRKNNNVIKKKIESLETKISKTFVDTIIDLQMEEQPLIIKKNVNGADICASCNQHISKNTFYGNGEMFSNYITNRTINTKPKTSNRSFINFTQPSNCKLIKNIDKNLNSNLSLGQNKLPDIIPSINTK
jgi:chromosome segregation ATPase